MLCPTCARENAEGSDACFSCGRSLYALVQGSVLSDRFEVQSMLGKGGMGVVYKAYDRELEELVALKVIRADIGESEANLRRFRDEVRLARRVRHPNVCAIHDHGQHGHLRYLIMEYIEGQDLRRWLRQRSRRETDELLSVARQIADGLAAIHAAGVVHRDLKPPNVMVVEGCQVRVMDFGIAKQLAAGTGATATGQVVGTPEYMSPEQARGQHLDARSDVYAFGILLFEIFTGQVPLHGDTPVATLMKQISEVPSVAHEALPHELRALVARALSKDRDARQGSMREVVAELDAARSALADSPAARRAPLTPATTAWRPIHGSAVAEEEQFARNEESTPVRTEAPTAVPTGKEPLVDTPAARAAPESPTVDTPHLWRPPARQAPPTPVEARRHAPTAVFALVAGGLTIAAVAVGLTLFFAPRERAAAPTGVAAPLTSANAPLVAPEPSAAKGVVEPVSRPEEVVTTLPRPVPSAAGGGRAVARLEPSPLAPRVPLGATLTSATVSNSPATLRVVVRPWGRVFVDGRSHGETPLAPLRLAPGRHVVRIEHDEYPTAERTIELAAGGVEVLTHEFVGGRAASATLRVRVRPWGRVSIDGKLRGETPLAPMTLAAGRHVLRIEHDDHPAVEQTLVLEPGQVREVDHDFGAAGRTNR
jgi:serine/threonine protein kinase